MSDVSVIITLLDSTNVDATWRWFQENWINSTLSLWDQASPCTICQGDCASDEKIVCGDRSYGGVMIISIKDVPGNLSVACSAVALSIEKSELKFLSILVCRSLINLEVLHGNLLKNNTNLEVKNV